MNILKNLINNPYFNALKNIRALLDVDQKRRGLLMLLLLLLNAAFDVFGLAMIFPLIDTALAPNTIHQKQYLVVLYNWIGVTDTLTFLFILSTIIFSIFLIKNIISLFIYWIQSRYAFNVSLRLSKKMFQHYYKQGLLYINQEDTGTKAYNIIYIPYLFASTYILQTFIFSTELIVLLILFLAILFFEPGAILVLLVVIVPTFLFVYQFTKNKIRDIGEKRNRLYPQTYALALESMAGFIDIKLHNKEAFFLITTFSYYKN